MPRPPRSPEGKAVRLTVYVLPETKRLITYHAAATQQSSGEVVDKLALGLGWTPIAPGLGKEASLPSLAGQPGVEHRTAAVSAPRSAAAVRNETTYVGAMAASIAKPDDVFYDHPGWKLSATGQNVCTRCGKTKIRSKNASCKAP